MTQPVHIFWFRRDLRLHDNTGLNAALRDGNVIPIFIFDTNILEELPKDDARVTFIYNQLDRIQSILKEKGSGLHIYHGDPKKIWSEILQEFSVKAVSWNRDYEPYAIRRDSEIQDMLESKDVQVKTYRDQMMAEPHEIFKPNEEPYTVFTPFSKKWKQIVDIDAQVNMDVRFDGFHSHSNEIPSLADIGFTKTDIELPDYTLDIVEDYERTRNIPSLKGTSMLGVHLRFGTVSIREIIQKVGKHESFLNELIWREFFMHILFHFPTSVKNNFKKKYDAVQWRNNGDDFERWKNGKTGYPMVDAGMRQLKETGWMHNRVRMVVGSFLCKHLLIDWRWGEAWFAEKLLDFDLSSNVGNWQWCAGTGCDAAPYFRVFNPTEQQKKFDPDFEYIQTWVPEWNTEKYSKPMIDHKYARDRALKAYKDALND